ncbi:beta-glucosidase 2 isoform X2 [Brachypodium distachyon]|uniref:beta-glucosidase 2 isoform X2 n=1 Tax=Brachypodium distachyon TaxID=15368 RepID=UPI00052FEC4B|nr:beta-glucosidase 2 isoform X2 [Brachypodium distachyon]|eukprot:XP_010235534.1 beta-glucosidase 2 isoform X2 [Brachypodium distachyon]
MGVTAFFYILLSLWVQDAAAIIDFTRCDFAQDFVFGAGTSAYQYEGAVAEDGRSPSDWDTFTHSGKMPDKSTGDIAADGYHKYKEDIKLIYETGLEAYRFSISWSRLIPNGRGAVNPKGLDYYNNIIDELVKRGIQTHITLHHIDLPQILEDEYGGWLSPRIIEDFTAYADVCFREFGDRVKYWTTVNEPNIGAIASYSIGHLPPGRCSDPFGITKCTVGNSSTEPYIAVHTTLLAHASVFKLYREKYKAEQKGVIGINIYSYWSYPFTNSTVDLEATQRSKDFMFGWILEPLVSGDYPEVMKNIVGSRLPSFTMVFETSMETCQFLTEGVPTNVPSDPDGLHLVLEYLKETYGNPPLYVHENGMGSPKDSLNDTYRVDCLSSYMGSTLDAIRNGVNVRGYFTWAFMDLFELRAGYQSKYGLYRVDFDDMRRPRQARLSARWYSGFLKKNGSSLLISRTQEDLTRNTVS